MFDAVLSASVLGSAVIFMLSGISLEAFVGVAISAFIIKSGIEMMIETLNDIIGIRADKELTQKIKRLLSDEPEVRGAYDLFIYNYGPDKNIASVHVEIPDTMTAREIDALTRRLEKKVYKETGVILTGVGIYAYRTGDDEEARIQNNVRQKVLSHDWALQFHGFFLDTGEKYMRFDVVMSFEIRPREGLEILLGELQQVYPDYHIEIAPDIDISD